MKQTFIFVSLCLVLAASAGKHGAVHVRGQLLCKGVPYVGEPVELYEKNVLFRDTLGSSDVTDKGGYFSLKASVEDWFSPVMYVYIENYCIESHLSVHSDVLQCGPTLKITVPEALVTEGNIPKMTLNLNEVELSTATPKSQERGIANIFSWLDGPEHTCRYRPIVSSTTPAPFGNLGQN